MTDVIKFNEYREILQLINGEGIRIISNQKEAIPELIKENKIEYTDFKDRWLNGTIWKE